MVVRTLNVKEIMKKILGILFLTVFSGMCAFAQFVPDTSKVNTVAEAKKLKDDTHVVLEGTISGAINDDKYTFKDATGEITVEIDGKIWKGLLVGPEDIVVIYGKVDVENRKHTIDVKEISKK
ncbi:MAG: hypothetical protein Ta2F_00620 [Termitinemataceae bacterium]|nr:MAG: hypothetical protein Ta2F_00620 [Termitinemataceae bacterium]